MNPPDTLPEALARLAAKWRRLGGMSRKDATNAIRRNLPYGGALGIAETYFAAAAELESTVSAFPHTATVSNP